ncbi:MAG: hypothetical protein DRP59_06775 [Spirochaetes bacterium]|nr:MAG: hypothetical protein DRP59_06775 [Spirochaetota bacterium]
MKRFQFKLDKVLALRENNEKNWKIKLGEVVSKMNRVRGEMKRIEQSHRQHFKDFSLEKEGLEYLKVAELYFRKMEEDLKNLGERMEELTLEREEIQQEYIKASNDRKVIAKLKDRREAEYYKEQKLSEIKEIDDLTTGVYGRAR